MIRIDEREAALGRLAVALAAGTDVHATIEEARHAGSTAAELLAYAAVVEDAWPDTSAREQVGAVVSDPGPWNRRETIEVRGHLTTVGRREGTDPTTIVLCHSIAMNHRLWEPVVTALPPEVNVLAYDSRNHGPDATADDFSFAACAEDLFALLDHYELGKVHLAGISMGGAIAQEFAIAHTDRVAALTLMATLGRGGKKTSAERAAAAEQDGLEAQLAQTLTRWFSPSFLSLNGPWVRFSRERLRGWTVSAWSQGWKALGNTDTIPHLPGVDVPALCIAGEEDSSTPSATLQTLVDALPDARLEVVPGPHLFPLEEPEKVARLLVEHHRRLR